MSIRDFIKNNLPTSFSRTIICDWDWWLYDLFKRKRRNKLNVRENVIHNVEDVGISETLHKDSDEPGGTSIS